jgi:hypothetical protein
MSNDATMRDTRNAAQAVDALILPGFAFNAWAPALANLGSEWQEFVSRRLQDDLGLLQQLGSPQSPEQAWTACVKFWQKAAEDYAREFATMSQLTGELVNSSLSGLQQHAEAAATQPPPTAKAA